MKFSPTLTLSALLALSGATPVLRGRQSASVNTQPMVSAEAAASSFGFSTTENGLSGGACAAMTVIFARGTTEPGNVGILAGPPFFNALEAQVGAGNVAVQGVDYPADIPGFLAGGDANGSKKMASLVAQAMTQCPSTKVVMAGYSQGGQLVHNAAKMMTAAQTNALSSVVIFGDPDNGKAVGNVPAAKTKVICHTGDNICQGGDLILTPHLTYSTNAGEAAAFVATAAGM